ncbi:universal stress protein [Martelella mediterranea]|uniref:Nucleotide-binding universal stress UspA family protein n=1 Tax=Martelella mediterranea TaxID=293089 RepID=A0A4R3NXU4_9HYPH|nr:universal stress protein [Martelella mediterranea]TCT44590.1 nucleotide-binding universal stress UspA family protein [Martelella mediterranea]
MFSKIMVPVDLAHVDKLNRGLSVAADMSKHFDAPVVYVGVTSSAPGSLGHNPREYAARLKAFCEAQAREYGISAESYVVISHDPAVDMNRNLADAITETGCDLVVMATHVPRLGDHFMHSHGGQVATHTSASIFLVRG